MKKKIYISFALVIVFSVAIFAFTACGGLVASTKPRQTMKTAENVLTALTTITTLPPDTYSEYISELEEINATPKNEQDYYYNNGNEFVPVVPTAPNQQISNPSQPEHNVTTTKNPLYVPRDTAFNGFSKTSKVSYEDEEILQNVTETITKTPAETALITTKPETITSVQTVTVSPETTIKNPPEIKDILDNLPSVPSDKID